MNVKQDMFCEQGDVMHNLCLVTVNTASYRLSVNCRGNNPTTLIGQVSSMLRLVKTE